MMRLAELIARMKAWQVFVAIVGPFLIAQALLMKEIVDLAPPGEPTDIEEFNQLFNKTLLLGLLIAVLFLVWMLAIGFVSNRRIELSIRPSMRWYVAAVIFAPSYFFLAGFVFFPRALESQGSLPAIFVVLHLAATVAMLYMLGFTAKNLIMAERQAPATFFDYSGPLFLFWFFPIGVWFVQPRVNDLVARSSVRT